MDSMKHVLASLDAIIANAESALQAASGGAIDAQKPGGANGATDAPKKQKQKKAKTPAAPPVPPPVSQFLQCDLRVGRITSVRMHPESLSLYALKVSYGDDSERSVCAGLRPYVTVDELKDALVVTICNLKPRMLRGVKSEAMILAGSVREGGEKEAVRPLVPPVSAKEGDIVRVSGIEGVRNVDKFVSGKNWDRVVQRLVVKDGVATYHGANMVVAGLDVACPLPDGAEIH